MSEKIKNVRFALVAMMLFIAAAVQAQTISGNVKDKALGEAVIGATVMEEGTQNGTVTDFDGNFSLTLKGKSHKLQISYVGMKTQTVDVKGKSSINVILEDDNSQLEELVVVGYGTMKKKDLTGAVATVSSEKLMEVPVNSAAEALTGKLAGVNITTTEGSPDAEVSIRVRGGGSVTQSSEPLYIVDGFPVESISDIPASDIEDITVLKDASSTAIYGSRGANGVILVTTKGGKEGNVKVAYNAYYSWSRIAKKLDVLNAGQYARWQNEYDLLKNKGEHSEKYLEFFGNPQDLDVYDTMGYNDWQEQTYGRTGESFNHNLNVNGGSDAIKYAFSYAHMNNKAIQYGSSFKRDNFSLKLNTKPTKTTKLNFQARYANTTIFGAGTNDANSSSSSDRRLRYSVLYQPIPLSAAGESDAEEEVGSSMYNPITAINDNDRKQERKTFNMNADFSWEIFKKFVVKTEWGYEDYDNYDRKYYGLTTYRVRNDNQKITLKDGTSAANMPEAIFAQTQRHRFRNTNTISYNFKELFGKNSKHTLDGLLGHEYVITKKRVNTDDVVGYPAFFDADKAWRLTSQGQPNPSGGVSDVTSPEDKLLSYFTRWNYNYDSKYYLTFTFRGDASSKFSKDNRWGYFPSASVAWRISSEPFMKSTEKWLDDLKFRVSFGTSGNNNIDPGYLLQTLESRSISYVEGKTGFFGPTSRMANPDLKWETTTTRNVGIDFSLFSGKLTGSADYYYNTTSDLLMDFTMSGPYSSQYRNIGKTKNEGVELTINYQAVNKKDWGLSFSGNISYNNNVIKSLGELGSFTQETRWNSTIGSDFYIEEGGSIGQIYGYKNAGRYEINDFDIDKSIATGNWELKEGVLSSAGVTGLVRPGALKLADTNNDGVIDAKDKTIIGNTSAKWTGGFGINARAYGFDLSANFTFRFNCDVYNANKVEYTTADRNSQYYNLISTMAPGSHWTNVDAAGNWIGDPQNWEALQAANANTGLWSPYMSNYTMTDWAVENGAFLRLSTLTLGYTLPKNLVRKFKVDNLRVYFTCQNLFCITNYSGFDPEVSTMRRGGSNLTPGVDYSAYPKSRQFVVGFNLNL